MSRGKKTYLVGTQIEEFATEAEAVASLNDRPVNDPVTVYAVTSAQELKPVMRLEKASEQ